MKPKRCKKCRCRLNDPAFPKQSEDRHDSGTCQECRADAGEMQAKLGLGQISPLQYYQYIQKKRAG
jgi:hypothetical protein